MAGGGDALDTLGLTLTQRAAHVLILLVGIALTVELVVVLAKGGEWQWFRHSAGPVALLYWLLMTLRLVGKGAGLLRDAAARDLEEAGGGEGAPVAASRVRWRRVALVFVLLGRKRMEKTLAAEFRRAMG